MKIGRQYLGKYVEVVWRDPCNAHVHSHDLEAHADIVKGVAALATWRERGVIDDLTDGVVRIVHSSAFDPPQVKDATHDFLMTWVPEGLIESITVFEPVKPPMEGGGG